MDPISIGIVSGLIANAATPLLANACRRALLANAAPSFLKELTGLEKSSTDGIQRKISNYLEKFAETQPIPSLEGRGKLLNFMRSDECISLLRGIYSYHIAQQNADNNKTIVDIRERFVSRCLDNLPENELHYNQILIEDIFRALVGGLELFLDDLVETGTLSAHELKSISRHKVVLNEIENIKLALEKPKIIDLGSHEVQEFLKKYKIVGCKHFSKITPPQLDAAEKVHIDDIFVSPTLVTSVLSEGDKFANVECDYYKMLLTTFRSIVLGDPGGGKSTLVTKIAYDLAQERAFEFNISVELVNQLSGDVTMRPTEEKVGAYHLLSEIDDWLIGVCIPTAKKRFPDDLHVLHLLSYESIDILEAMLQKFGISCIFQEYDYVGLGRITRLCHGEIIVDRLITWSGDQNLVEKFYDKLEILGTYLYDNRGDLELLGTVAGRRTFSLNYADDEINLTKKQLSQLSHEQITAFLFLLRKLLLAQPSHSGTAKTAQSKDWEVIRQIKALGGIQRLIAAREGANIKHERLLQALSKFGLPEWSVYVVFSDLFMIDKKQSNLYSS
ncbi:MAG: hypothetical protein ACFCUQ_05775 [Kiloniellales bacterium]